MSNEAKKGSFRERAKYYPTTLSYCVDMEIIITPADAIFVPFERQFD
jgi:hypothetical protein